MKRKLTRYLANWLKYRKLRKEQEQRAASLAVQLVLNGCLAPPRLNGCKGKDRKGDRPPVVKGPVPIHFVITRGGAA